MASCAPLNLRSSPPPAKGGCSYIIVVRMVFTSFQVTVSTFSPANVGSCHFLLRLSPFVPAEVCVCRVLTPCVAEFRPVLSWVQAPEDEREKACTHSPVHPWLMLQERGRFGSSFLLPARGLFLFVSLKPFKAHLKVELLFLEGMARGC